MRCFSIVLVYIDMSIAVNEILSNHNVDKQISDSKGDVSAPGRRKHLTW
jgi:hypothetical protein